MVEINTDSNVVLMQITRFKIILSVEIVMGDALSNESLASLGMFLYSWLLNEVKQKKVVYVLIIILQVMVHSLNM